MDEIAFESLLVPPEVGGIQVNFCKSPACANYGVAASGHKKPQGRPRKLAEGEKPVEVRYKPDADNDEYYLKCQRCPESLPAKSNDGIKKELDRLSAYLYPPAVLLSCPKDDCAQHTADVTANPKLYYVHAKTVTGSIRYKCKQCGSTFTDVVKASTISRHKKSHKNVSIFVDIVNKKPLKGIARSHKISMKTLYDKINFIHRQCLGFAADRERLLPTIQKKWMEVAVDRQVHKVNWVNRSDRRNIDLYAIASSDNRSGYVFGFHINFDPLADAVAVEQDTTDCNDYAKTKPFRKHARYWLAQEYKEAASGTKPQKFREIDVRKSAAELVTEAYASAEARKDVEASDSMDANCMLPLRGMQVHSEYTMYAHFMLLAQQLKGVKYLRFYLDQDSGIRAACLAAFVDKILAKECNVFYVKNSKGLTQMEKLARVSKWTKIREEFVYCDKSYEEAKDYAIRRAIIVERMAKAQVFGKWQDAWIELPLATMQEPEKMACYLTNLKTDSLDIEPHHLATMFDRASLHSVDTFFMKVRRAVSVLERPINSSSTGRRYSDYNAYRPETVVKLAEIFRVYHNYVQMTEGRKRRKLAQGEQKRKRGEAQKVFATPAMRLGLASGQVREEDILYFMRGSQAPTP